MFNLAETSKVNEPREPASFIDEIRQAAENIQNENGFVYEPTSGLYYDRITGYYYNAVIEATKLKQIERKVEQYQYYLHSRNMDCTTTAIPVAITNSMWKKTNSNFTPKLQPYAIQRIRFSNDPKTND